MILQPSLVKEFLRYDCGTGKLYWRPRAEKHFKTGRSHKIWNKRYSNVEAFTTEVKGYKSGRILDKGYLAHRVIFCILHDRWPIGEVDHIDGDPSNNTADNLREVSSSENSMNTKVHAHNTSGVMGVYFETFTGRWVGSVEKNGLRLKKRFKTKDEAVGYRTQMQQEWGYHRNHGKR